MTNKVSIKSKRIDNIHQRYFISSNMNGRRSLHQGSPKKKNGRWIDKHGSPPTKTNANKNKSKETSSQVDVINEGNSSEQVFNAHNSFSPLYGLEDHKIDPCGDPHTPFEQENSDHPIYHFEMDQQKVQEFHAQRDGEWTQRQEEYDHEMSHRQEEGNRCGLIDKSNLVDYFEHMTNQ